MKDSNPFAQLAGTQTEQTDEEVIERRKSNEKTGLLALASIAEDMPPFMPVDEETFTDPYVCCKATICVLEGLEHVVKTTRETVKEFLSLTPEDAYQQAHIVTSGADSIIKAAAPTLEFFTGLKQALEHSDTEENKLAVTREFVRMFHRFNGTTE